MKLVGRTAPSSSPPGTYASLFPRSILLRDRIICLSIASAGTPGSAKLPWPQRRSQHHSEAADMSSFSSRGGCQRCVAFRSWRRWKTRCGSGRTSLLVGKCSIEIKARSKSADSPPSCNEHRSPCEATISAARASHKRARSRLSSSNTTTRAPRCRVFLDSHKMRLSAYKLKHSLQRFVMSASVSAEAASSAKRAPRR